MLESDIANQLKTKLPELSLDWVVAEKGDSALFVPADKTVEVASALKSDPALSMDFLMNLSAFDEKEHIEVTYHFYSYKHRHKLNIKVKAARGGGVVASLCSVYGTANFQEREVFDHFGVTFSAHPDMRRILLPDDWVGFPLLKDYQEQEEYNGIGTTRPPLL